MGGTCTLGFCILPILTVGNLLHKEATQCIRFAWNQRLKKKKKIEPKPPVLFLTLCSVLVVKMTLQVGEHGTFLRVVSAEEIIDRKQQVEKNQQRILDYY